MTGTGEATKPLTEWAPGIMPGDPIYCPTAAVMDPPPSPPADPPRPDEVNRLWQHGMHEERLFHDRLNYFSAIQVGLLGVFAILYPKEPAPGVFAPLTAVGLPAEGENGTGLIATVGRNEPRSRF
jgi:hypothetical protein